jgi:hypothetical protein
MMNFSDFALPREHFANSTVNIPPRGRFPAGE